MSCEGCGAGRWEAAPGHRLGTAWAPISPGLTPCPLPLSPSYAAVNISACPS
jgi:hypothetical protein